MEQLLAINDLLAQGKTQEAQQVADLDYPANYAQTQSVPTTPGAEQNQQGDVQTQQTAPVEQATPDVQQTVKAPVENETAASNVDDGGCCKYGRCTTSRCVEADANQTCFRRRTCTL